MRLSDGDRVAIVGGGPAGSFFALHCLRLAAQAHLKLEVIIYEARDFDHPGPRGCNKCAGVISPTLMQNLGTLDLALPPSVVQARLKAYVLHMRSGELLLRPPASTPWLASVFRGSGPRLGSPPVPMSFDGWLLAQAETRGAVIRHESVRTVLPGPRPTVQTAREHIPVDLVVLCTGVNSRAPLDHAWGYRAPRGEAMAQDEVRVEGQAPADRVHIYFDGLPGLVFGSLVPKDRYVNISLLGHGLPRDAVSTFVSNCDLSAVLPGESPRLCGCRPRIGVSPARGYYGDRMVAVGDAAVTRLYKDGIGSAFVTAEAAARTAIERGVARADFAAGYRPVCDRIIADNRYGRMLFRLWRLAHHLPVMMRAWERVMREEAGSPDAGYVHRRMLWDMFTGDESYRQVFRLMLSRPALSGLWQGALAGSRQA